LSGPRGSIGAALAALAAAAMIVGGCGGESEPAGGPVLRCYVGGTMRPAMEELVRLYQERTGRRVELDFGDSGANLIKVEQTGRGDLYVAHDPFHGAIVHKDLSVDAWVAAVLRPVIAVAKGNPKNVHGLKDLARPGICVILTDAQYSTAGHLVALMLRKANLEEAVDKNVVSRTRLGGDAANAVALGTADAAIVWQAVVHLRSDKLDAVPIEPAFMPQPGVDAVTSPTFGPIDMGTIRVTIDVLRASAHPDAARAFAEFAAAPEQWPAWENLGFDPPPPGPRRLAPEGGAEGAAAPAQAKPTLLLYAGAGLRPAMDDLVHAYQEKTGVAVDVDYGGSGMIISRLRLSHQGDLFMPGDVWYVELAEKEDLVASKTMVCYYVPVILVEKGNPKNIHGLKDLLRPGIRLGLGNPKACQVGRASEAVFAKNGISPEAVAKNLVFSSVTVNELGVQVTMGQLDAAIVWDAVAVYYADRADVVPIPLAENDISNVAVAVLKCSRQPEAAQRFVDFLLGPDGQAIFHKHQYRTEPPR
jgi:molybdate transport system substrate-binding protein